MTTPAVLPGLADTGRRLLGRLYLRRPSADTGLGILVCLLLLVLIGAPMVLVLAQAFYPGILRGNFEFAGLSNLFELFNRRLWRVSLTNSLYLAAGTAVLGTLLGASLAVMRHSARFAGAAALDVTAWALLIMPSFVIAQGWILFSIRDGIAAQWLGLPMVYDWVFSPNGLVVIMSLTNYPFAYLAVSAAMQWHVREYQHAAQLCGAGVWRTLLTIRFPLLLPAILSGMVLVFIDTIGDFGLPAALATTYRYPTLPYTIYAAINQSPIRFDLAGVLSFYLVVILAIAVSLYFWLLRRSRFDFLTARAQAGYIGSQKFSILLSVVALGFVVLALGVPIGTSFSLSVIERISGGLAWDNLTLRFYGEILTPGSRFLQALQNSLRIAAWAAVGSIVVSVSAAYLLTFSRFSLNRLIDVTCTATLAVPGVILGVGFIFVWNHPWLGQWGLNLYGNPAILVLAAMAGAIPIAIRVVLGAMSQVPASFLNAAALQGVSLQRRILTIVIPLTLGAILSATLAAFGTGVFDLAITSILHPPGYPVLPVVINRQFQQGYYGLSTASTMVAGLVTVLIIMLVNQGVRWACKPLFQSTAAHKAAPAGEPDDAEA